MPPTEEVGFKYIQQVQQRESRSQNLTRVPADFYESVDRQLASLREAVRREVAKDPMSTAATLVQNELRSTLRLVSDITSLRLRKMANRAVDSLEGGRVDLRNLTPGEREIYGEMARVIARSRDALAGPARNGESGAAAGAEARAGARAEAGPGAGVAEGPEAASDPAAIGEGPPVEAVEEAAGGATGGTAGGAAARPTPTDAGASGAGGVLLHVLKDTPSFAGEEGISYSLKRGDLVNLPGKLADILVSRGVAEAVHIEGEGED